MISYGSFATRTSNALAGIIALLVALLIPGAYFAVSYQYLVGTTDSQAELSALSVTSIIQANPTTWMFEQVRLAELLERRLQHDEPEYRRLAANGGETIADHGDILEKPVLTRHYHVYDSGSEAATLEISRSLRPLVDRTILVAFCSLIAAAITFFSARILPRRAIQRAFDAFTESELRYRSLFSSMREGVALHRLIRDDGGQVVSYELVDINPACERLMGLGRDEAMKADAASLLDGGIKDQLGLIVKAVEKRQPLSFELTRAAHSQYLHVSVFSPAPDHFAVLFEDISDRKTSEMQIQQLAYYDSLTGLPNRTLLHDRLNQAIARAGRDGKRLAVLFLDLDRFKDINDSLGHASGDQLLIEAARRLAPKIRRSDTLARLGGDEFVIMLSSSNEESNVAHMARSVLELLSAPYSLSGRQIFSSVSIGIATYPEDGLDAETLLRCADLAMYAAKQGGRNSFNFFSPEMNRKVNERLELEHDLRRAIAPGQQELFLEFQPVVNTRTGRYIGVEALVRWQHPTRGLIMPDQFIPVAEDTGLIMPLGEWVLREACRTLSDWLAAGNPPIRMAINVSGRQIILEDFPVLVASALAETGAPADLIELELTESVLMEHAAGTSVALNRLKGLGVSIAIDDFGTGYSSLGYLKNFALDRLKIDRSFVRDIYNTDNDQTIIEAIIAMASRLNLKVIAEGVETIDQMNFLLGCGCEEVQGYYFSKPLSVVQLTETLNRPPRPLGSSAGSPAATVSSLPTRPL